MKKGKVELMAPAGSFESLMAAIQAGADSVYFGIEQLNMRARASINFTLDDLPEIARIGKKHSIKTYITLNTIVYDHDLSLVKAIINQAKENDISAIIAADQAVIAYARQAGMEVHISTQVNVTNVETVRFYSLFADVMVLARELSLKQMKLIVDQIRKENICGPSGELIRIEVFAHGALCMAVSGKCYLSLHTYNSSANRGACIQNCRRTYTVRDKEDGFEFDIDNEYIMSAKDLCTIDFMDRLLDTGVSVLKIEGRGRAPEYVKTVVGCYREAIDAVDNGTYTKSGVEEWVKKLETVYNKGFWSGYYLGQKLGEWADDHGSRATQKKVYVGKGVHYYPKIGVASFKIEAHQLKVGDKVLITGNTTGVFETEVEDIQMEGKSIRQAKKGETIAIKTNERIRPSDKLYKLVEA